MFLLIGGFTSCDNTDDYISDMNADPELFFIVEKQVENEEGGDSTKIERTKILRDSLKLKNGYGFELTVEDKNYNLEYARLRDYIYESGFLVVDTTVVDQDLGINTGEPKEFFYHAFEEGQHNIVIVAEDEFVKTDQVTLELTVFENLPPKADFTVTRTNDLVYELDASSSFDRDEEHGGGITEYVFIIEGQTIRSYKPVFNYSFSEAGKYTIALTTIDNDGVSSEAKMKFVDIY